MKISHNDLVKLIKECMMDMENDYPNQSKSIEIMHLRNPRTHMLPHGVTRNLHKDSGRMLDYGSVKSDSHEGRMVKNNLFNISRMATELHEMLHDQDDLPEWVQDKLATVKDRLESCYSYLMSELEDYDENNE